jgi:hypothetical protein
MATGNLFGTGGESNSLYGNSLSSGQILPNSFIYFEWFIFRTSSAQPATPTGGSWNFLTNVGTAPTGWTSFITGVPLDSVWFSIAFVDSRSPTNIVWSEPGLISATTSIYATAYADTFTGDGIDTTWTLTQDPVVVNNLDVSINGVTQVPVVDYTVSGTTFTTTTPAPLGSVILVKYRQALPNSYFGTANNVGYTPPFTNSVATNVEAKLAQTISVQDFGAVGDGIADDAAAILAAFNYSRSVGGCGVSFPKATYLISHGFNVPTNTTVYLNGSTIKATTTFSQGTIPTYGAISMFEVSHRTPFLTDPAIENISFIGDGAILDGRRDEQTGSPAGYDGILFETSDTPQQADFGKIKNILVSDITIDRAGYDGFYVGGVDDMEVRNVKTFFSPRIGIVVVGGTNIRFIDCESSFTIGDNPGSPTPGPGNSGDGFWNEPNNTWQTIDVKYLNCYASKNYQSGFKPYNAGADATLSIELIACKGFDNCWDEVTGTRISSPAEANFRVFLNDTASALAYILFKDCVSQTSERSGFSLQRGAASGSGYRQRIIVDNLVVMDCNRSNTDGANRSPIYIPTTAATTYPLIVFNAPIVISTFNNTLGYGIAVDDPTGVFINNPIFAGVFSQQMFISGTFPGSRTTSNVPNFFLDPNADQSPTGISGDTTQFYKPIRLASFDQTAQPSVGNLFANELSVWQTDDNQFVGMFKRDDSSSLQYLNFRNAQRLRGVLNLSASSANISAQSVETHTLTVTGAVVGAYVEVSMNVALNNALILQAQVSATNTVTVNIHNPSSGTISRAAGFVTVNVLSSD